MVVLFQSVFWKSHQLRKVLETERNNTYVKSPKRNTKLHLHVEPAFSVFCIKFSDPLSSDLFPSSSFEYNLDSASPAKDPFTSPPSAGTVAIVHSKGNDDCHVILRGGATGPNYGKEFVEKSAFIALSYFLSFTKILETVYDPYRIFGI